jgi:hypothetical protein
LRQGWTALSTFEFSSTEDAVQYLPTMTQPFIGNQKVADGNLMT